MRLCDFEVLLKGEKMLSALIYRVCVMIQKVFGIHQFQMFSIAPSGSDM